MVNVTVSTPAKQRRIIRPGYLAPLPPKLTTKTRVKGSIKDGEVLFAVAEELGRLYRTTLAARLNTGKRFDSKADFNSLQRDLTLSVPSRYSGTIALDVRQEYALAKRNTSAHRSLLRRRLENAKGREEILRMRRIGSPLPTRLAKVKLSAGLTLDGARRQVERLESRLRRVESELETGHFSVCKGSASLLRTRLHLDPSRFAGAEEWRREWQAERLYLACYGQMGAKWGNRLITIDSQGVCEIALPKDPRFKQYDNTGRGRYRLDARIDFSYQGAAWRAALAAREAIYYSFSYDPRVGRKGKSGQGRWYLGATISTPTPPLPLAQSLPEARSGGVVAIDLNHGLLACRYVDANGNPASSVYDIELDWTGTHAKERLTCLGQELTKLCQWARAKGVRALAVENLDFADLKGKKRSRTTNQKLHGIPTAAFRHLLVAIAARHGLRVIACDPAYTSADGKHWADVGPQRQDYKLSRHQAAAICIGRRSLALALRRRSPHPTRGSKQRLMSPGVGDGGSLRSDHLQGKPKRTKPPPSRGRPGDSAGARPTRRTTGPMRAHRSLSIEAGTLKLA